jgi:aerobic carbon-monoxide dehydrogenase medium subunit
MLPPFKILNVNSVTDAVKELRRLGDDAKIYGGGTELLILLRHNLIRTDYLVNIKPISELNSIQRVNGTVSIGASVTHRRLETDQTIHEMLPMLAGAESQVANIRVRSQGTLGGNLCFNDPHSDPATVLLVHDATVQIAGSNGRRQIPLHQFLLGMYSTALEPDELLLSVDVPRLPSEFGDCYLRIHRLQRPTLGVAAAVSLRNGSLGDVRLAVGCVGPKALRLIELEEKLRGADPRDIRKMIDESKSYLSSLLNPVDDLLGSAEYKIYITGVLLARALHQAVQDVKRK